MSAPKIFVSFGPTSLRWDLTASFSLPFGLLWFEEVGVGLSSGKRSFSLNLSSLIIVSLFFPPGGTSFFKRAGFLSSASTGLAEDPEEVLEP